jgi:hypothetical protein
LIVPVGRRARSRAAALALAVPVALALTVAGCGSSPTTPAVNPAKAPAAIGAAYQTLFDLANKSVAAKVAVVQDGSSLSSALSQALSSSAAGGIAGASVHSTTLLSKSQCATKGVAFPCASVGYDLLGTNGTPALAGQTGYASYIGGKWLVSKITVCDLLGLFYGVENLKGVPPGCTSS